jgi:hypothetical protein
VLVLGSGLSAATNVVALADLAKAEPATRITWITRREGGANAGGPVQVIKNDSLPMRASLAQQANTLAQGGGAVTWWPRTFVGQVQRDGAGRFEVSLSGEHAGAIQVDRLLANVGFRPDDSLSEELHLEVGTPAVDASALRGVLTGEPNYYVVGSKSCGRRQRDFSVWQAYEQIREVFKIIGDRHGLDLYASSKRLLR